MPACCFGPVLLMLTLQGAAPPLPDRQSRTEQPRIWREPAAATQAGRIGMPVAGNLHIGVGRFSAADVTRPRTHTEPIDRGADIVRRDRGRAAVGLSLRF